MPASTKPLYDRDEIAYHHDRMTSAAARSASPRRPRRRARLAAVAAAAAVAAGLGCGAKLPDRVEALAERACACPDAACAADVRREMEQLLASVEAPDKADVARITKAMARAADCIAQRGGGR
ncbi:MAG: hypothetical protein D6689_18270 [Deltaproteobacteria bacterium]|nr:MAG: hypothetical protein D6689_18270 [Deltaproteobacteria bacterium]